jgi:hypothetical protein
MGRRFRPSWHSAGRIENCHHGRDRDAKDDQCQQDVLEPPSHTEPRLSRRFGRS